MNLRFVASLNGEMMSRGKNRKVPLVFGLSLLLSIVLFLFDWYKPIEIAVWLFYLIPLLFTAYVAPRRTSYLLLLICTLLIGLGHARGTPHIRPQRGVPQPFDRGHRALACHRHPAGEKTGGRQPPGEQGAVPGPGGTFPGDDLHPAGGKIRFHQQCGSEDFSAPSTPKDILGKPVLDFLHPENRQSAADRIRMEQE